MIAYEQLPGIGSVIGKAPIKLPTPTPYTAMDTAAPSVVQPSIPARFSPQEPGSSTNNIGYDQYDYLQKQFPGFQLGPNQTTVQGLPITQFGRDISADPTFANVLSPLYNPVTANTPANLGNININSLPDYNTSLNGGQTFQQGQDILNNDIINDPQTQKVLDYIRSQGDLSRAKGISDAQALATARGINGSSTEQFGVQQAASQADQATLGAQTQLLLQNLQQQQAARTTVANALFSRASQEGTVGAQGSQALFQGGVDRNNLLANLQSQRDISQQGNQFQTANTLATLNAARLNQVANLTSDQVASIVNQRNNVDNRAVQLKLGTDATRTANEANDIAKKNADNAGDPFNILIGGIGNGLPF